MANRHGGKRLGSGRKSGFKFSPDMVQRRLALIKFDEIIQRLESSALAGDGPMSTAQIAAATALIDRLAPKLTATELSGEVARPTVIRAPETVANSKTWLEKHGPARVDPEPKPDQVN